MATDPDLLWLGTMMGAEQVFTDGEMIALLCPALAGKTLAQLTPAEFDQLMAAAQACSLSKIPEEEED
jgi:hypothetical protein